MPTAARLYLGIDVGGSKTHALIADQQGHVLGAGRAGPANWEIVGLEGTYHALARALDMALTGAGVRAGDLHAAGYGLAGLDWPSDEGRLQPVVERLGVPGPRALVNDAYAALYAGSRDGVGVAIIAGTGSTIAGRNRRGDLFRTFGLGATWGDFGGAGDVVELAARAVSHAYTGRGRPTTLTQRFVAHFGAADVPELVERLTRGAIDTPGGALAPAVFAAAAEGDAVAQEIVRYTGAELGQNAAAVARRLELTGEEFDLVMAGGVFRSGSEMLVETLLDPVRACAPGVRPVRLQAPPVVGSVLLAMQVAGEQASPDTHARLADEAFASMARLERESV